MQGTALFRHDSGHELGELPRINYLRGTKLIAYSLLLPELSEPVCVDRRSDLGQEFSSRLKSDNPRRQEEVKQIRKERALIPHVLKYHLMFFKAPCTERTKAEEINRWGLGNCTADLLACAVSVLPAARLRVPVACLGTRLEFDGLFYYPLLLPTEDGWSLSTVPATDRVECAYLAWEPCRP